MRSSRSRFDLDASRERAGDKVFARGQAYHRDGQVEILAFEPGWVLAQVAGTEDYRTKLTGRGEDIGGECSCPAFVDWGFCKHMVAAALAANAVGGDPAGEEAGALPRIRDLKRKGVDALVEMIVGMAVGSLRRGTRIDLYAPRLGALDPSRIRWNHLIRTSKRSIFKSLERVGRRNRYPLSPDAL